MAWRPLACMGNWVGASTGSLGSSARTWLPGLPCSVLYFAMRAALWLLLLASSTNGQPSPQACTTSSTCPGGAAAQACIGGTCAACSPSCTGQQQCVPLGSGPSSPTCGIPCTSSSTCPANSACITGSGSFSSYPPSTCQACSSTCLPWQLCTYSSTQLGCQSKPCSTTSDCPSASYCISGSCSGCYSCSAPQQCLLVPAVGSFSSYTTCALPCTTTSQCSVGQMCTGGACMTPYTAPATCTRNAGCVSGSACVPCSQPPRVTSCLHFFSLS